MHLNIRYRLGIFLDKKVAFEDTEMLKKNNHYVYIPSHTST